jgi:hypothetical protein
MKTGFVYIWYDRKHKRYYIGSHWGKEDDGYICSSTWMRNSYKRRSIDFKRRIIIKNIQNKKIMLETEHYFLSFIGQNELGKKYYNLTTHVAIPNGNGVLSEEVREKMRERRLSRKDCPRTGKKHSEETKKKFSEMRKGKEPWNKGKKLSLEHRQKLSESHKDQTPWNKGKTYTFEERRRHE